MARNARTSRSARAERMTKVIGQMTKIPKLKIKVKIRQTQQLKWRIVMPLHPKSQLQEFQSPKPKKELLLSRFMLFALVK
jgi:hypothetical protein